MANSQSALTASIANEARFEIDTYHEASCDTSFYNGHYYSGQPPGISFISAPIYIASKPIFYILPQKAIDFAFSKLEAYGNTLPADYWGKKKVLSSYFNGLSKRQILEYIFLSGFILPIFTTSLISALSVLLVYLFLKRFTGNEKLRILITLFYAFGTALFRSSTQFLERPIAAALMFTAFFVLFRIKHNELKPSGSILFWSGILAGISAWFDYFHLFLSGLLFLYILSFYAEGAKGRKNLWIFNLNGARLLLLSKFIIGVLIPALLLFVYYYIIFDDPFANSYTHRIVPTSDAKISDIVNIKLPTMAELYHVLLFFVYSPVILVAFYGIYKALLKKDKYYHEALYTLALIIFVSVYASVLVFTHPTLIPQFKRHMEPIFPYAILFLAYALLSNKKAKRQGMNMFLVVIGLISVFMNWTSAQYDLDHFDPASKQLVLVLYFLKNGPGSSFFGTLAGIFSINSFMLNLIGLAALASLIYLIWKPCLKKGHQFMQCSQR